MRLLEFVEILTGCYNGGTGGPKLSMLMYSVCLCVDVFVCVRCIAGRVASVEEEVEIMTLLFF